MFNTPNRKSINFDQYWQNQDNRLKKISNVKLNKSDVYLLPLGGIGEIGMNAMAYHSKGRWILTDCGNSFDKLYSNSSHIVVPSMSFFHDKMDQLDAIIITHAHQDHIGALPYLWENIGKPIYGNKFTNTMIRKQFEEKGLDTKHIIDVEPGKWYKIGTFEVKWILVSHSIPGSCMVAIRTEEGSILHTGDWKIDEAPLLNEHTDFDSLQQLAQEDLHAVICDSTNVSEEGINPTEESVSESMIELIKKIRKGRIFVTFFSTNISRLYTCIEAAKLSGRKVGILGRSLQRTYEVSIEAGYIERQDHVILENIESVPPDEILIACSGSQGEENSALKRIAAGEHRFINIDKGDTVIFSSRVIPTNSKEVVMLENALLKRGINIITNREALVHTSGHPRRKDLDIFYNFIKKHAKRKIWAIPCHGTAMFLKRHAEFVRPMGFLTFDENEAFCDGKIYKLFPGVEFVNEIEHEIMFIDGRNIISTKSPIVTERKILQEGYVSIALWFTKGKSNPIFNINSYGVHEDKKEIEYHIAKIIRKVLSDHSRPDFKQRTENYSLSQSVKYHASMFMRNTYEKNIHIEIHILKDNDKNARSIEVIDNDQNIKEMQETNDTEKSVF